MTIKRFEDSWYDFCLQTDCCVPSIDPTSYESGFDRPLTFLRQVVLSRWKTWKHENCVNTVQYYFWTFYEKSNNWPQVWHLWSRPFRSTWSFGHGVHRTPLKKRVHGPYKVNRFALITFWFDHLVNFSMKRITTRRSHLKRNLVACTPLGLSTRLFSPEKWGIANRVRFLHWENQQNRQIFF